MVLQQNQNQMAVNIEHLTRNLAQGYIENGDEKEVHMFFPQGLNLCNVCNQDGELSKCKTCKKNFHKECAGVSVITADFQCEDCKTDSKESLLRQLKEAA